MLLAVSCVNRQESKVKVLLGIFFIQFLSVPISHSDGSIVIKPHSIKEDGN